MDSLRQAQPNLPRCVSFGGLDRAAGESGLSIIGPHGPSRTAEETQMPLSKQQHLDPNTPPKRILSLDGGGIRGILTLEFLGVIESMLRKRSGRDDFRLCDYFDLIGGTSTGSIIAAGLA
jgi:hypothetical protein